MLGKKECQQNYLTSAHQHPTCERSYPGVLLAACGWHLHLHLRFAGPCRWFAGATLLYLLTGSLPWAVTANFDVGAGPRPPAT